MRRTSFAGALVVIAIGAVLAFAVQASPKDFDLQEAGLIIMLAGVADVVVRCVVAGSPLSSRRQVVQVEPAAEPSLREQQTMVIDPVSEPVLGSDPDPDPMADPTLVLDYDRATREMPVVAPRPGYAPDTPEAPDAVRTVTGRPIHPRGRWAGRGF